MIYHIIWFGALGLCFGGVAVYAVVKGSGRLEGAEWTGLLIRKELWTAR